jgi:hypothetical protein
LTETSFYGAYLYFDESGNKVVSRSWDEETDDTEKEAFVEM